MKYSDSYLMRMTKKELIDMIKCLDHNVEEERKSNNRQYKMLCEYEKYKWHDIRKNPEDLPDDKFMVFTCHKISNVICYDSCFYENGMFDDCFSDMKESITESTIAWRYIEPFEEDKP